jgi:hypothetical protein
MNPFTRYLRQWLNNKDLDEFVSYWDRLEAFTIQIYREQISHEEARPEFDVIWPWLKRRYPDWRAELAPYWRQTKVAGQPTQCDPFQLLLDLCQVEAISGNWNAMQHLPAAREAINKLLQDSLAGK